MMPDVYILLLCVGGIGAIIITQWYCFHDDYVLWRNNNERKK